MKNGKLRRTPKIFGTSYRPQVRASSRTTSQSRSLSWRPITFLITTTLLIVLLARLPFFQIKAVTFDGINDQKLMNELQALVGRSIFSPEIGRVTNRWLAHDPALASLSCRRGIPNTVICHAKTRAGVIIWRHGTAEFWVDQNGRAFAARSPAEPLKPIVEDRVAAVMIGNDVASAEIIETFLRLDRALTDRSIVVRHFFIADALYQPGALVSAFPLTNQTVVQREVSVFFAATESIEAQVKTLAGLLSTRGDRVANRVDLRVPGYVYFH